MQRRKVETSHAPAPVSAAGITRRGRSKRSSTNHQLALLLITICILLGTISILSPSTVERAEQQAASTTKELVHDVYVAEQQMEHSVDQWLHPQQQPPPEILHENVAEKQASIQDASEAMKRQPSSWVDGEKKLKQKLKELVKRQAQGKDLGVPILTRWLGEDMPVWLEQGQDEAAWNKKRQERYDEMKREEEAWRKEVRKYLQEQDDKLMATE
jgi:hypothetical protein